MSNGYACSCGFAWSLLRGSRVPLLQAQRVRVQDGDDGLELIIDESFGKQTNKQTNKQTLSQKAVFIELIWMVFTGWFIFGTQIYTYKL